VTNDSDRASQKPGTSGPANCGTPGYGETLRTGHSRSITARARLGAYGAHHGTSR